MDLERCQQRVKRRLEEGKSIPLRETEDVSEETVLLVHYLLKWDLDKFKKFYVATTQAKDEGDLDKAALRIYKTDVEGLERQWHDWVRKQ